MNGAYQQQGERNTPTASERSTGTTSGWWFRLPFCLISCSLSSSSIRPSWTLSSSPWRGCPNHTQGSRITQRMRTIVSLHRAHHDTSTVVVGWLVVSRSSREPHGVNRPPPSATLNINDVATPHHLWACYFLHGQRWHSRQRELWPLPPRAHPAHTNV